MEPREPKFQWGERVLASFDLYNDGSYPQLAAGRAAGAHRG